MRLKWTERERIGLNSPNGLKLTEMNLEQFDREHLRLLAL